MKKIAVTVALLWTMTTLSAQTHKPWAAPRTPWGDPDLQGVFTNEDEGNVPLERPDGFAGRTLDSITAAELAEFTSQSNEARREASTRNNGFVGGLSPLRFDLKPSRPWLIVDPPDGKIPPLTEMGRRRQAALTANRGDQPITSLESMSLSLRCISLGLPGAMLPVGAGFTYQIVQSPGFVAIRYESINDARVIPLQDVPRPTDAVRNYLGVARGHWDGDTLVVDTTNFKGQFARTAAAGPNLRLIERFKPLPSGSVEWTVTINDDGWTRPWTFSMPLTKVDAHHAPLENACHEGNYGMRYMLRGALSQGEK